MAIYIKLTIAGSDVGPFDLYSDIDGFVTSFETNVSRQELVDGFLCSSVPYGTTQIKIQSTGTCTNYVIVDVLIPSTTTTTSTTTTSVSPTTTTTTTILETFYRVTQCPPLSGDFTIAKTAVVALNDNLVFETIPPDGNHYCGEVVDDNFPTGPATATIFSPINWPCDDVTHCYQAPV